MCSGRGIDFFEEFSEALTKARSENKIVFVDFVASGVSLVRQMSAEVFSQEIISAYLTRDLFMCKLMLKKEQSLPKSNDVTSSPSMLFLVRRRLSNKL